MMKVGEVYPAGPAAEADYWLVVGMARRRKNFVCLGFSKDKSLVSCVTMPGDKIQAAPIGEGDATFSFKLYE